MTKLSNKSPVQRRPRPTPNPRVAPHRKAADRRLRILERLTAGCRSRISRGSRNSRLGGRPQIIAATLESRDIDPPAGFVQLQVARLSAADDRQSYDDDGGRSAGGRQNDQARARARSLSRLRAGSRAAGVVPAPAAHGAVRLQLTKSTRAEETEAKFSASQRVEIAENREGISEISPPRHDRACPGHPCRHAAGKATDWPERRHVDGRNEPRDEPGHDGEGSFDRRLVLMIPTIPSAFPACRSGEARGSRSLGRCRCRRN
jgi:hypothetical protein